MEIITKNSLAKDLYDYKSIYANVLFGMLCMFAVNKNIILLAFMAAITFTNITFYTKPVSQIYKGQFVIIKQKVLNTLEGIVEFNFGNMSIDIADELKENDSMFIVFEGNKPVMVYKETDFQLDEELNKHLLDETETNNFVRRLKDNF